MKREIKLENIMPYIPYDLEIYYKGVVNGKELSKWYKEHRNYDIFDKPIYPYPDKKLGMKIGKIKKIETYLNYWKLRVGNGHKNIGQREIGKDAFLILRPLSDLTKEIEHKGEIFMPTYKLFELEYSGTHHVENMRGIYTDLQGRFLTTSHLGTATQSSINIHEIGLNNYWKINKLFEWHFDINNLIIEGLAIDINTLK